MFQAKNFYRGSIPGSLTTLYTHSSSSGKGSIRKFSISNNNSYSVIVKIYIVPNGSSASNANALVPSWTILPFSTVEYSSWVVMSTTGDTIQATATPGSAAALTIDGAYTS